jgi:hypothetical protein
MLRIGKEAMQQQNERLEEYANVAFGVRQGRAIVARHRATIDRLQDTGQNTDAAKQRLKQLVGFLQIFEEDYSRLKGELEDAS